MADDIDMAEPAEATSVESFHESLQATLGENEPMCLAMIRIGVDDEGDGDASSVPDDDVVAAVQTRLSTQLRGYDLMARVDGRTFILVVKTLADVRVLDSRMFELYNRLSEPYDLDEAEVPVPVALGAAVRLPAEPAGELIARAGKALAAAEAAGGKAPVLI
jgi:predicted signal transduction protein with EAL and GGDEF domain